MPRRRKTSSNARDWKLVRYSTAQVSEESSSRILREFTGDEFGFGEGVAAFEIFQIEAGAIFGAERFAEAIGVVGDDGAGGVENILGGAIVALELDDFGVAEIAREAHQDGDVGAAPAIDGLIFVTDDAEILLGVGEEAHQVVLDAIGVLIFVNVEILEAGLPFFADERIVAEHERGAEEEVVEVERVAGFELAFVFGEDVGDFAAVGADGFGAEFFGSGGVIFGVADGAEDVARSESFGVDGELGDGELDGGELVVGVVDGEIFGELGGGGFAAEEAGAEGVEGGQPRRGGRDSCFEEEVGDAGAHFLGGFVGEGDGEDGFGGSAVGDEVGHAESDGAGFAGAGAGEDEDGAFGGFGGTTLFGIELVQEILHFWFSECGSRATLSSEYFR